MRNIWQAKFNLMAGQLRRTGRNLGSRLVDWLNNSLKQHNYAATLKIETFGLWILNVCM